MRVRVLGESATSPTNRALREEIRRSPRVRALLSARDREGRVEPARHPYAKWQGAHWVLLHLAELGYPPGDGALFPVRDQVLDAWLDPFYFAEFEAKSSSQAYGKHGVPVMQGRHRRCASQQGNALFAILALGLDDGRVPRLVERLLHWQWPDGGWNCDKNPSADTSSFVETIWPLRGLALYARKKSSKPARLAAARASDVLLSRHLFKRRSTGKPIHPEFSLLHFPSYWHYDILAGLRVMAAAGFVKDARCAAALDLLESKRLEDGGWPAEKRYYKVGQALTLGADRVDWGGTSRRAMNEWVTVEALSVLQAAGRRPR
ncbi:MAG: hypothetical protein AAB074_15130 [Planctomycetota bacterium]